MKSDVISPEGDQQPTSFGQYRWLKNRAQDDTVKGQHWRQTLTSWKQPPKQKQDRKRSSADTIKPTTQNDHTHLKVFKCLGKVLLIPQVPIYTNDHAQEVKDSGKSNHFNAEETCRLSVLWHTMEADGFFTV